jgi:hypothetical protein
LEQIIDDHIPAEIHGSMTGPHYRGLVAPFLVIYHLKHQVDQMIEIRHKSEAFIFR